MKSIFKGLRDWQFATCRSPLDIFRERKLLYQSTSQHLDDAEFKAQTEKRISNGQALSVYCGYDPTARSLHIGNLVSIIMMCRLQAQAQLRPIFVIGGATGMIGDPSGKSKERQLLDEGLLEANLLGVEKDISNVFQKLQNQLYTNHHQYGWQKFSQPIKPILLNNHQFYKQTSFINFLRNIGKVFRMNSLLAKQTVANRLKSEEGISFTQFSYSIMQAYDFYMLHRQYGCMVQFGGSDQWGNITNGCELIKKMSQGKEEGYGITMPLLLNKQGEKFGKSEGNALFLNSEITPLEKVYEYMYNTSDEQVQQLLYIFTFYSPEKIQQIMREHQKQPEKRQAQRLLAEKVTGYLGSYQNVKQEFFKLSSQQVRARDEEYFVKLYSHIPETEKKNISYSQQQRENKNLIDLLTENKITSSKKQARREITGKGIYLNNYQLDAAYIEMNLSSILSKHLQHNKYLVIRRGKKHYYFLTFL